MSVRISKYEAKIFVQENFGESKSINQNAGVYVQKHVIDALEERTKHFVCSDVI